MPFPSITIEPQVGGGPVIDIIPCEGVTMVATMPAGTTIFEEGGRCGLHALKNDEVVVSFTVHADGTLECEGLDAEYYLQLPQDLANELRAVFQGKNGQELVDPVNLEAEGDLNPEQVEENPQGGRKRRSGVKKQTRRTKGKRRRTIRK